MSLDYYDDSFDSDSNLPHYARITFFGQLPYTMTKERIIVGRNSAAGMVDIDVGSVSFVSRKHLELTFSYQKLKVKCLGKNGIFIDNTFKSHSCIPYELPAKCTLRFPSTDVQFCVEQLIGMKSPAKCRTYGKAKNFLRYFDETDESPEHKRIKLQPRLESDLSEQDNNNGNYNGFREVICNFSDNEVEEFIHNDEAVRKLSVSDCDGLMNETEDNDAVLMENIGNYSLDASVSLTNLSKDFTLDGIKPEMHSGMMRGLEHSNNPGSGGGGGRPITKLLVSSVRYSNEHYVSNGSGRIAVLDQDDLTIEHGSDTQKPPYSYAQLIVQAVSTARDRQLTLNGIYNYISKNYPYFKAHDKGWQNSVRHNLSLNRYFIKVPRGQDEPGKGSFWRVDPTYETKLISQAFRKRRLRNNTSGMMPEPTLVSQMLNVSAMDSGGGGGGGGSQSNSKVFGVSKSAHLVNRTTNLSNVITFKRACDLNNQNGGTTYMLRNPSSLSSHGDIQKYILTNPPGNGSVDGLNKSGTNLNGGGSIFKCQTGGDNGLKLSSAATVTKSESLLQQHPQHQSGQFPMSNAGRTLISLGGRLYSTTSIKSLQQVSNSSHHQQQHHPPSRIIATSAAALNHHNSSAFDSNATDSSDATSVSNMMHPKNGGAGSLAAAGGNSYYLISSPPSIKGRKSAVQGVGGSGSANCISSSLPPDSSHHSSPITIAGTPNRRIISIQAQSPGIRKIDLSNGGLHNDSQIKSPIIVKKVKIHNNNFVTVKSCVESGQHLSGAVVASSEDDGVLGTGDPSEGDQHHHHGGIRYPELMRRGGGEVCEPGDGNQVFISDGGVGISSGGPCDMDHFLICHSDPALPDHASDPGSSPLLYKHHRHPGEDDGGVVCEDDTSDRHTEDGDNEDDEDDDDELWHHREVDEDNGVTVKMEPLKYMVDAECD